MDGECVERTDGPTPNGGAYFVAYYFDQAGHPVARMMAWYVEIHEFGADDVLIQKHFAYLGEPEEATEG